MTEEVDVFGWPYCAVDAAALSTRQPWGRSLIAPERTRTTADAAAIATWTAEVVASEPLEIELRPAIPVYEGRGAGPNTWLSVTATTHDRHGFKIVNIWFEMSNGMKLVALQPMPGSSRLPFLVTDHDRLQLLYEVAPLVEAVRDLGKQSGEQVTFARVVLEDSANRRHERSAAMPILDPSQYK